MSEAMNTATARRLESEREDFAGDIREETERKAETIADLFGAADAAKLSPLGKYTAKLLKPKCGWSKSIVHGTRTTKNGYVESETNSFVPLVFKDVDSDRPIIAGNKYTADDGLEHRCSTRLYAANVESLRNAMNRQLKGAALGLSTKQMLDTLTECELYVWVSWNVKYNCSQLDFFDREAWEKAKAEKAKAAAESRKAATGRPTEDKATA